MEFAVDGAGGVDGYGGEFGVMMTPTVILLCHSSASSFPPPSISILASFFFYGLAFVLFTGCLRVFFFFFFFAFSIDIVMMSDDMFLRKEGTCKKFSLKFSSLV